MCWCVCVFDSAAVTATVVDINQAPRKRNDANASRKHIGHGYSIYLNIDRYVALKVRSSRVCVFFLSPSENWPIKAPHKNIKFHCVRINAATYRNEGHDETIIHISIPIKSK